MDEVWPLIGFLFEEPETDEKAWLFLVNFAPWATKLLEEPTAETVEEEPLELGTDEDSEELLLESDDILTTPVGKPPIAPPTDEETATEDQPTAAGGTLFERMSNIARGASKAQIEEDETETGLKREPIDIPRFLNRQNNQ